MQTMIKGLALTTLAGAAALALAASESRDLSGFDRVTFALPGTLVLERGEAFEVTLNGADADLERVRTAVTGGQLTIGWDAGILGMFGGGRAEGPLEVRVTLPELAGLEVAGSGRVEGGSWLSPELSVEVSGSGGVRFEELSVEHLRIELAGSGSAEVSRLDSARLDVEISGSGNVSLAGAADLQDIEVMGSGDVQARELEGARVQVRIMGSGDVTVWATEHLNAETMGSGDVRYRGSPQVESEEHGSGRVRPL